MSAKNLDNHNRWRNRQVAFRLSPVPSTLSTSPMPKRSCSMTCPAFKSPQGNPCVLVPVTGVTRFIPCGTLAGRWLTGVRWVKGVLSSLPLQGVSAYSSSRKVLRVTGVLLCHGESDSS